MQTANVLVALGGDRGNSVPKTGVTVAEIAVLMAIHGGDAVYDIRPLDEESDIGVRDEIARLRETYPAKDEDGKSIVEGVYPGRNPMVHRDFTDLDLPEDLFATESRVTPKPKAKGKAKTKTTKAAAKSEPNPPANDADHLFDDDEDGDVLS